MAVTLPHVQDVRSTPSMPQSSSLGFTSESVVKFDGRVVKRRRLPQSNPPQLKVVDNAPSEPAPPPRSRSGIVSWLVGELHGLRDFLWCRQFVDDFGGFTRVISERLKVGREAVLLGVARCVILVEEPDALLGPEAVLPVSVKQSEPPPASMVRCVDSLPALVEAPVVESPEDEEGMLSLADIEYLLGGV